MTKKLNQKMIDNIKNYSITTLSSFAEGIRQTIGMYIGHRGNKGYLNMIRELIQNGLDEEQKLSKMSKGMQEKVQLVLVMSRKAKLYILDEPLGGVDPATRDYILDTILTNFNENASIIISTHLISDIERILDDVIFIDKGKIALTSEADKLREKEKTGIDEIFRRMFKC